MKLNSSINIFSIHNSQLKNPGAAGKVIKVVGGAQKDLINKMLKSSVSEQSAGGGGGTGAPNILRGGSGGIGGGSGVTAVAFPASALVAASSAPSSPKSMQQSSVRLTDFNSVDVTKLIQIT